MDNTINDIPDLDDLLFELRNKDYGAYQLRKRYNSVVITGIIISSLLFSSLIIIPFILNTRTDKVVSGGMYYVQVQMENLDPPIEEIYVPPPPPPPPEPSIIQEVSKYIPPVVVDTILPFEPIQATVDDILSQPSSDIIEVASSGSGDDLFYGEDGGVTDDPFVLVETMPSFRGGDISKFREWVGKRTNYPQAAIDNRIRGTVYLTFIVEKDGSVSNVTVLKGVDPLLDNEAVKAISESPRWTPGLQRGQPVRVRFQIPMNFMF